MLIKIRNFLYGRDTQNALRFKYQLCDRPGPDPNLPPGPSHKLSGNYYYTRDGRREVTRPLVLSDQMAPKSLEAGTGTPSEGAPAVAATKGRRTPGAYFNYSSPKY